MSVESVSAAQESANKLGRRFLLTALLPAALLALLVFVIVGSGALHHTPRLPDILAAVGNLKAGELALLALAILVTSLLMQPFQITLVQLLEGYWGYTALDQRLFEIGVELQRRRWQALDFLATHNVGTPLEQRRQRRAISRLRHYPVPDRLMPTRLGNVLRASEDRAGERYGLGTIPTWPRMTPSLSDRLYAAIGDARTQIDVGARLAIIFFLAALVALGLLISHGGWWLLVIPPGLAVLAMLSYRSAVSAAQAHALLIDAAYDLHRFDMYKALHYKLPDTTAEEFKLGRALTKFLHEAEAWLEKQEFIDGVPHSSMKPRNRYEHT